MGESKSKKKARERQDQISAILADALAKANVRADQIFALLAPFGEEALEIGRQALQGNAPSFFREQLRGGIGQSFEGARENLIGQFGRSGQGISGLAAGPIANLEVEQAQAISDAELQSILAGINLGFQGGNVLQGQQAFFDPTRFGSAATQANSAFFQMAPTNPFGSLLGGLASAGLGGLGAATGNPFLAAAGFGGLGGR